MDEVNTGAFTRTDRFGDNRDPTFPQFFMEAVVDELASQRSGHQIYRDEERVKIHIPGNSLSTPVERVNDLHRQRWPDAYKRFKEGLEMSHEGTPLELWPPMKSKAQVLWLKSLDIHTVEQMAQVSDFNLGKLGIGALGLRQLAKAYLDSAERTAMTSSLMAENDRLSVELISAQSQIGELKNLINGMQVQLDGLASRPNIVAHHVPGQHDPYAAFASAPQVAAPTDPLASFAKHAPKDAA
jgi:hypothetical protein